MGAKKFRILVALISFLVVLSFGVSFDTSRGHFVRFGSEAFAAPITSTVVNSSYSTYGNGGRKLVRLSNGWLVAAVSKTASPQQILFYKSEDNGVSWSQLCTASVNASAGYAIASYGTNVYMIACNSAGGSNYFAKFDSTTVTGYLSMSSIDYPQSSFGPGCSIICDSSGSIYAVWCSKSSSDSGLNLRYAKSTDGGATWPNLSQITLASSSSYSSFAFNPCIVLCGNTPAIVFEQSGYMLLYGSIYGSCNGITMVKMDSSLSTNSYLASGWTYSNLSNNSEYAQSSPCAVVSPNGRIWCTWYGKDSYDTAYNIKILYSDNNGSSWNSGGITNCKITTGNTYTQMYPSISVDSYNNVYLMWEGITSASSYYYNLRKAVWTGGTWSNITEVASQSGRHMENPSLCSNSPYFTEPLFIYQDSYASAVKFQGLALQLPTLTAASPIQNGVYNENDVIAPSISISDSNNYTCTCRYYVDSETTPRDTETVSNTLTSQTVSFTQLNANTLTEGAHAIKFEVFNGFEKQVSTVNFSVERKPVIIDASVSTTQNSIAVTGLATDNGTGLAPLPYRFTIGENTSDWVSLNSDSANSSVVNQMYGTSGNGGRKLVRLNNGWLVSGVCDSGSTKIVLYKSIDNGKNWSELCYMPGTWNGGFALSSYENTVYVLGVCSTDTYNYFFKIDAATQTDTAVTYTSRPDSGQSSFGTGCSIACDSSGTIYATWCSKNTSYPNSFNIRYSKSTDGGTTWLKSNDSAGVEQITTYNDTAVNVTQSCIVVSSNKPVILCTISGGTSYSINACYYNNLNVLQRSTVYSGASYRSQSNPCAVVSPNGRIWCAWHGTDATDSSYSNIRIKYSDNNGATWVDGGITNEKLTSGNSYAQQNATIAVDIFNNVYVIWEGRTQTNPNYFNLRKMVRIGGTWRSITEMTSQNVNNIGSPSLCSNYAKFSDSFIVYQDNQAGAVKFMGTIFVDSTYTVSNLEGGKMYPVTFEVKDNAGQIATYSKNVYTKAHFPEMSASRTTSTAIELIDYSLNSSETQYLINCGTKYVSRTGALINNPQWITLTDKKILVTGLQPNTSYEFTAKARNGELIETEARMSLIEFTDPLVPVVPGNIKVNTISSKCIKLTWNAVSGADGYDVEETVGGVATVVATNIQSPGLTRQSLNAYTTYSYRIRSVNSGGTSSWSIPISMTTFVGIPQDVDCLGNGTSINFSWSAVNGAQKYDVEVDGEYVTTVSTTSYQLKGLLPQTLHTYRIRAKNFQGEGEWSAIDLAGTGFAKTPAAPVVTSKRTNNTIILNWNENVEAECYEVVEVIGGILGQPVDNGLLTTYEVKGLLSGSTHTYRVRAKNYQHTGSWSTDVTVTTYKLDTPANITYSESDTQVTFTWDAVQGDGINPVTYDISINGVVTTGIATSAYLKTGLTANTKYLVKIKARATGQESEWSDEIPFFTLPTKPSVPANVSAIVTDTAIRITWVEVTGAVGFDIELDGIILENDSATSYLHDGLDPCSLHSYRVRARNSAVEGDWCSLQSIRTLPAKPEAPDRIVVKSSQTGATLAWDAELGATGYDIEVFDGISTTEIQNISRTSYTHRQVGQYVECKYRVRTRNVQGISPWSGYIINNSVKKNSTRGSSMTMNVGMTDVVDFTPYTMVITYNPGVMDVTDLCTQTGRNELAVGKIDGTGITIKEFTPGRIVFVVDKVLTSGEAWTGVINSVKFKGKVTGGTTVTYTVYCKI